MVLSVLHVFFFVYECVHVCCGCTALGLLQLHLLTINSFEATYSMKEDFFIDIIYFEAKPKVYVQDRFLFHDSYLVCNFVSLISA